MQPSEDKPVAWYFTKKSVFLGLAIFGPLALPLVWFSSKFSYAQKIVLILTTIALTVLLFKFSTAAIDLLSQRLEEMKTLGY